MLFLERKAGLCSKIYYSFKKNTTDKCAGLFIISPEAKQSILLSSKKELRFSIFIGEIYP